MPVTARLSKAFYDQFGEQVANELVEWFNAVDLTYRTELRTLNDTNFARFEAVLAARMQQADARWDARFAEFEARWEVRFTRLESRWESRFAELESRWEARFAQFELSVQRALTQQTRWMIGLWLTNMVGILAILAQLSRG